MTIHSTSRMFVLIFLAALTIAAAGASGQIADTTEHRQLVAQYFKAVQLGDWSTMFDLIHPDELDRFKEFMLTTLKTASAEEQKELFQNVFPGYESIEALDSIDPGYFAVSILEYMFAEVPFALDLLSNAEMTVLGHVEEGEDMIHTVYRYVFRMEGIDITRVRLLTAKRSDGVWKLLLEESMADMLNSQRE